MSPGYLGTVPGILKIAEMVLSIITFGLAAAVSDHSWGKGESGFGWVSFVAIAGFLIALICLLIHFTLSTSWAWPRIVELGVYALWTVCFAIAGIVAAALHDTNHGDYPYRNTKHYNRTAAAAAAFSFFCMVLWAVDTVLMAMNTRVSVTTHTVTTTTTTNVNTDVPQRFEGNPQY